jgi:3D (Asp-Asp-Asp) domain-containing protein
MKKDDKASVSLKKILILSIIAIFALGIVVFAANAQISSITIEYPDGERINVITTKTIVSEILKENHIIILPEEHVYPSLESEITNSKTIIISKEEIVEKQIAKIEEQIGLDKILEEYAPIVEKIVVVQEEIPFETITQDITNGSTNTQNRIIQNGVNGIKEVTYKIRYKNDVELDRVEISSKVIKEPVNKVVQIQVKATSRLGGRVATTNPATTASTTLAKKVENITPVIKTMNTSAYCACSKCCGKSTGITSSGARASAWYTLAAGSGYPIGTVIYIPYFSDKPNGGWFVVQDRGGAITNNKLDVYMNTHSQALSFGRQNLECYIYL